MVVGTYNWAMTVSVAAHHGVPAGKRAIAVAGLLLAGVIAVVVLLWAKWLPYAAKATGVANSHAWVGSNILAVGGVAPGDAPSVHAAFTFTQAYGLAVWQALVAALLIGAAVQTLIPRTWLLRVLNRRGLVAGAVVGGLASTPSMMCTCCTAPVAATLRRSGVPTAPAVAYWLGNPLLNPAVVVFLLFVAPWQWTVTRLVVGGVVVVAGSLVARLVDGKTHRESAMPGRPELQAGVQVVGVPRTVAGDSEPVGASWLVQAPVRYGKGLLRLVLTLVPEYLVVVLLLGAFRGWLFPIGHDAVSAGALVVVLAAVVGTLVVIPTAAEIPILQGLAVAGLSLGAIGALLVTLPAVSLPGMAMVGRAFGWRVTLATSDVAVLGGVLAGGLLAVL